MNRTDLWGAVRDAHHDLTRVLVALNDVSTPREHMLAQLESFQLMVTMHAGAEARVYAVTLEACPADRALALLAATTEDEHQDQLAAAERLARTRPGSLTWHEQVRELRSRVLDHAASSERRIAKLQHRMPAMTAIMAREYAMARLHILRAEQFRGTPDPLADPGYFG